MWAVIAAALGIADTANKGNQAQYAQQQQAASDSLAFSEAKDMAFYSAYAGSAKTITTIAILGFLFLAVITFFLLRK